MYFNKLNATFAFTPVAGIFKACFGLENDHFHENQPKTLVLASIRTQRHMCPLVLEEINIVGRIGK